MTIPENNYDIYGLIEMMNKIGNKHEIQFSLLKGKIVIKTNLREWMHIFTLRTSNKAHPIMQNIMRPLLEEIKTRIPIIFDNIKLISYRFSFI